MGSVGGVRKCNRKAASASGDAEGQPPCPSTGSLAGGTLSQRLSQAQSRLEQRLTELKTRYGPDGLAIVLHKCCFNMKMLQKTPYLTAEG